MEHRLLWCQLPSITAKVWSVEKDNKFEYWEVERYFGKIRTVIQIPAGPHALMLVDELIKPDVPFKI